MKNLYERLKPEYREKLDEDLKGYGNAVYLIEILKKLYYVRDMTLGEYYDLRLYTDSINQPYEYFYDDSL